MRALVAEDEEDIKSVYHVTLIDRGHEVILTSDGEECVKVYRQQLILEEQQQQRQQHPPPPHHQDIANSPSYFDVVVLDYKMPKKDGLQTAKEILEINPEQRIIFASAYVMGTLEESIKELKRIVELMQKPFSMSALIDTVENGEAYEGLKILMNTSRDLIKDLENPSRDQIKELFEALRRVQKFKGF